MSHLPSIYEHAEHNIAHDSAPSERIHSHLGIVRGATISSVSNVVPAVSAARFNIPPKSLAVGSDNPDLMDLGTTSGATASDHYAPLNRGFPFAHSPPPQVVSYSPLTNTRPYPSTKSNDYHDLNPADGAQTVPVRPTPGANFSALFPSPQPVSSVRTTYSNQYNSTVNFPSSSTLKSSPSPLPSSRYNPYARPSDNPGHYTNNSSTSKYSASPAAPSSNSLISSSSLVGSRPSNHSYSAAIADFTSPPALANVTPNTQLASTSFDSSSIKQSGLPSWQGSSSASPANDPCPGPAVSVAFQPLGDLEDSQRRSLTPHLTSNPAVPLNSSLSSTYPHYNTGQLGDYNQGLDGQKDSNDTFASYVRRPGSGQHGFHLQTLQDGSAYTHPALTRQSTPSALGSHAGPSGSPPYFDRASFDASLLPLPGKTRNILNPSPAPTSQSAFDNRPDSAPRSHHLSQILSDNNLTTMNHSMYHGDMDMDQMDSYDEDELLSALPQDHAAVYDGLDNFHESSHGGKKDSKQVRRRSSKACDQCRKSKCKCERTADDEACKSCVMLGTPCTFLGPSRRRGPPKGYIDAIESRLHQTEALVGILLSLANPEQGPLDQEAPRPDERARSLLEDLRENDPLAREIVDRVDRGAYGTKGRKAGASQAKCDSKSKTRSTSKTSGDEQSSTSSAIIKDSSGSGSVMGGPPLSVQGRGRMVGLRQEIEANSLATAHPSNEWQDAMVERMRATTRRRDNNIDPMANFEREHQRRRLRGTSPQQESGSSSTIVNQTSHATAQASHSPALRFNNSISSPTATSFGQVDGHDVEHVEGEERIADGVGQLSINEEAQVRFHGKASGLHLLGQKQRLDGRNKGGIWHFPKARVWPPVAPTSAVYVQREKEAVDRERAARERLPSREIQEHLLELYWAHVHPILPVIHKQSFLEAFKKMHNEAKDRFEAGTTDMDGAESAADKTSTSEASHTAQAAPQDLPTILLLAIFSIAARYAPLAYGLASPFGRTSEVEPSGLQPQEDSVSETQKADDAVKKSPTSMELDLDNTLPRPQSGHMWTAGDGFLERAKDLMDRAYSSSRPSTCQALLLMAYREIGIGAMAQSWLYTGMAVRMAQDLGMHRSSENWTSDDMPLFTPVQQQVRKRIWYSCVIMDKYVSTYIGRPLSIFEADYDTRLPSDDEVEEMELWEPHHSLPNSLLGDESDFATFPVPHYEPAPAHVLSCFNESARLSSILARIVQAIYVVTPSASRQSELAHLEEVLDMWYMELPPPLQYNSSVKSAEPPPPNVLTLHMQYWTTVILLHRPFIPHYFSLRRKAAEDPGSPIDSNAYSAAQKNFNLCVAAANHITSIITVYQERFCLKRCPVFLSYYIFTAGIMHMTTMSAIPKDPQAPIGLNKCMEILKRIDLVWPSAARAWELLDGAKDDLPNYSFSPPPPESRMLKRSAEGIPMISSAQVSDMRTPSMDAHSPYDARFSDVGVAGVPLYNSYERVPQDSAAMGLPVGLSTSVLPQQYSTGLVEDRVIMNTHRSQTNVDDGHGRYTQYWSDYSMGHPSSMLGSMYDMSLITHPPPNAHLLERHNSEGHGHHPSSDYHAAGSLYHINNHYNMYPGGHLTP